MLQTSQVRPVAFVGRGGGGGGRPGDGARAQDKLTIGRNTIASKPHSGYIDDVRIYNAPLTAAEIKGLVALKKA